MRGPAAEQEQRQSVRERPILFSGPMVRAILDGRKTQTRRVVVAPRWAGETVDIDCLYDLASGIRPEPDPWPWANSLDGKGWWKLECPYGQPGDRLWVRETFWDHGDFGDFKGDPLARVATLEERIEYRATEWDRKDAEGAGGWKPSIHMPRWASRLTLEITEVRVERLQEISNDDAQAEGINMPPSFAVAEFRRLWDSLNAKRGFGWTANPFVWVISFQSPAQTATSKKGGKP